MTQEAVHITSATPAKSSKLKDYMVFTKMRLASLVIFSAFITYITAAKYYNVPIDWLKTLWLSIGGLLVTAGSNGFNQIIERDLDAMMERTKTRPLPTGKMSVAEAWFVALFCGIAGTLVLWFELNPLTGMLGLISMISYSAIYTPLKQKSSWAVFVGAFPGAAPPLIGWVAFEASYLGQNIISPAALSLFVLQFMWQFPHFWAIAWKAHDDYQKAGFMLLPSSGGKNKNSAFQILLYTLFLFPISVLPCFPTFGVGGLTSIVVVLACGVIMLRPAIKLFYTLEDKWATKLMFASFIYLPIVLIVFLIDQFI